jgi:hypothetical protein
MSAGRTADCFWARAADLAPKSSGHHQVADPYPDEACGPKADLLSAAFPKNHRGAPGAPTATVNPVEARLEKQALREGVPTPAVGSTRTETTLESIVAGDLRLP